MAFPSRSLTTLRPDLRPAYEEFDLEISKQGFVALRVLPELSVPSQAGVFPKIPIKQLLNVASAERAPDGSYQLSEWSFEDAAYSCKEYGLAERLDARLLAMYKEVIDAELVATRRSMRGNLASMEVRAAAAIFNTTTWSGSSLTAAASPAWSDLDDSDPIADVDNAREKIWINCGQVPDALIFNWKVFRNLRKNEKILERIVSGGAGNPTKATDVTAQMLAQVFDVDEVIVAGSFKDTANAGQAFAGGAIWSNSYAMLAKIARGGDVSAVGLGRHFHWSGDDSQIMGAVEHYWDDHRRSDFIRVRHDVQAKIIHPECGFLITGVT